MAEVIEQGGKTANRSGKDLETTIGDLIHRRGYPELERKQVKELCRDAALSAFGRRWFAEQVRLCPNLYGGMTIVDFMVYDADRYPEGLFIESKWQQSPGSVDEKYVYTVGGLKRAHPISSVLVLDGGGYRPGAMAWARRQQCDTFTVLTIGEFYAWSRANL